MIKIDNGWLYMSWILNEDRIETKDDCLFQGNKGYFNLGKILYLNEVQSVSKITFDRIYKFDICIRDCSMTLEATKPNQDKIIQAHEYITDFCHLKGDTGKNYLSDYDLKKYKSKSKDVNYAYDIANDIFKEITTGQLFINTNFLEMNDIMAKLKTLGILEILKRLSIEKCGEYANKMQLNNYSVTNIANSNVSGILEGDNFYMFDESESLTFLPVPLTYYKFTYVEGIEFKMIDDIPIFDYLKSKSADISRFPREFIKDFEITGSQVSLVSSKQTKNNTKLISTMMSEFLFGTSYTLLKGLSSNMINISSKVEDLRNIQIVFTDKTEIRVTGISIYYDLNRILGRSKNKEADNNIVNSQNNKSANNNTIPLTESLVDQLKQLKTLLDLEIVTQEEFDEKKRQILGL